MRSRMAEAGLPNRAGVSLRFPWVVPAILLALAFALALPHDASGFDTRGTWELVQRDTLTTEYEYFSMCYADCDSLDITFSFAVLDYEYESYIAGLAFRADMTGEGTLGGDYYYLRVYSTSNTSTLELRMVQTGVDSLLASSPLNYMPVGSQYKMRVWAKGTDLRGKVWMPIDPEPSLWHAQATDETFANGDIAFLTCHTAARFFYIEVAPPSPISAGPEPFTDSVILGKAIVGQNVPNPFNPATRIDFSVNTTGKATLRIYDSEGRLVRTLLDEPKSRGNYSIYWNGRDDSGRQMVSGVYFYELRVEQRGLEDRSAKKMILLR